MDESGGVADGNGGSGRSSWGRQKRVLFCANSKCAPIANIRYWHAPITNICYWHGQRADKAHSLLAVPIANRRHNRSNSECRRNNDCPREGLLLELRTPLPLPAPRANAFTSTTTLGILLSTNTPDYNFYQRAEKVQSQKKHDISPPTVSCSCKHPHLEE